jgi:DNA-binding transcriptional LysR family regulator
MIDVRRLVVLRAVVQAGSVTGAASELGYTASAVSQSVAALERETRTRLLERVGRGVRPTEAALLLSRVAGDISVRLADAETSLARLRDGQSGTVRVTSFATGGTVLVPQALAAFRADRPGVDLRFDVAEADEAVPAVASGRTDVAVVALTASPDTADILCWQLLLRDPYLLVLPAGHSEAHRRAIKLSALADDTWVATASARCDSRKTVIRACGEAGFTPRFELEADEFPTTVGFVAAGLGVAMVPRLALDAVPSDVVVRQPAEPTPIREVYAVTARERSAADTALVEHLRVAAHAIAGA